MRYILMISALFMLFSCNTQKKENPINDEENPQVVEENKTYHYTVIFEKRENAKRQDYPTESSPSDVSHIYYMDNFQFNHYLPNDKEGNDTLNIAVDRDNLLVDLTYYQMDRFPYLMEANDTLWVHYKRGLPIVKPSENREHRKYDFAYDAFQMAYFKDKKGANDELMNLLDTTTDLTGFLAQKKEMIDKESKLLDSLYAGSMLSKPYYEILKERRKYEYLSLLSFPAVQKILEDPSVPYTVEDLNKEELLDYPFYHIFLVQYMYSILNGNTGFKAANGFTHDSRSAFDAVVEDPNIKSEKIKDLLLKYALGEIYKFFSEEDFETYFSKFKEQVTDPSLVTHFEEKFLLKHKKHEKIKEVYLATADQEEVSLNELLYKNRGKLVYVDFWASWCAPCIAEMPASKKLQEEYKDKSVTFVYISIDSDGEKWRNSAEHLKINIEDKDFIAINYPQASFYKEMELRSIPRYMLFNKNGELLYQNAPAPSSEQIREVMDQHLKES